MVLLKLANKVRCFHWKKNPKYPSRISQLQDFIIFDHQAVKFAKRLKPSKRGELEILDLIRCYHQTGQTKSRTVRDEVLAWLDTGTHDALLQASTICSSSSGKTRVENRLSGRNCMANGIY